MRPLGGSDLGWVDETWIHTRGGVSEAGAFALFGARALPRPVIRHGHLWDSAVSIQMELYP